MLDYTKAAGEKIFKDMQKIAFICSILAQIFSIVYLIYAIASKTGVFAVNLFALILSCSYLFAFLYNHYYEIKTILKKTITGVFKWSKRAIKLFNLSIAIYAIVFTAREPSALSVIFTVIMAFLWIADILLEIVIRLAKSWWALFITGIKADFEVISKPVSAVGNFFKRVTGKEVEETDDKPTKQRKYLDTLVEEARIEKQNSRLEKRFLKAQEKAEKSAKKRAMKNAKRNHAPSVYHETAVTEEEYQGE